MGFTVTIKKCEKEIFEFKIRKRQEINNLTQQAFERSKSLKKLKEPSQFQLGEKKL